MPLLRNTIVYLVLGFLPIAANFFLAPIYTSYLSPNEYALIGIATLFQTFVSFFISLSLDGAFSRLFFKYQKQPSSNNLLLSSLLISICLTTMVVWAILYFIGDSLFGLLLQNKEFKFSNYGSWVLLTSSANVFFTFFAAYYRNHEKVYTFTYISIAFFIVPVASTLAGLVILKRGVEGVIVGRAIGSMVVCIVLLGIFFKKTGVGFSKTLFKEALIYSFPLIPYQLMFAAFSNIDRIMLEQRFTAHDFGVYNFASLVSGVVLIFITALYNAVNPKLYKSITDGQDENYIKRLNYLTLVTSIGFTTVCVAVVVPMFRLFINVQYADAYNYIGILFLSYIPYAHYLVYSLPLFYHSKTKAFPVISFFALITGIGFNLLFIPLIGVWSVCFSLFVIRFVQMGASYYFLRSYGFHNVHYIKQQKPLWGSFAIIAIYSIIVVLNKKYAVIAIDFVNLLPLLLFLIIVFYTYRKALEKYFYFSSLVTTFMK